MYPIITISREFGSGGHSIAQKLADQLAIPLYDSIIVEQVAKESGFDSDLVEQQGEYASRSSKWFAGLTLSSNSYYESPQDQIFRIQSKIIRDFAEKGPCVIVGRCANYILQQSGFLTLNVFIHADTKFRAARVLDRYGETSVNIYKRLEQKDRDRKTYYKFYTNQQWGDYHNYHISLDSSLLGEDTCAQMILQAAERMNEMEF